MESYVCALKHVSIDKPNEDSYRRREWWQQKKMEERLRCSDRNVVCVFLWYLFTGIYCETDMMTQWPATREGGAAMFGASAWLKRI